MATRKDWISAAAFLLLAAAVAIIAGCNSLTDDPGDSTAIVTVTSFSPTEACVDYDGTPVDDNGDGTTDFTTYVSVENTVAFESTIRNGSDGTFNDVTFSRVDIYYEMTAGPGPANRLGEQVSFTVPAGGTADYGLTTVLATDVPLFDATSRGSIRLVFSGRDVAGEPRRAEGRLPIRSVTFCN